MKIQYSFIDSFVQGGPSARELREVAEVCRTLLGQRGLQDLWTPVGPTQAACELRDWDWSWARVKEEVAGALRRLGNNEIAAPERFGEPAHFYADEDDLVTLVRLAFSVWHVAGGPTTLVTDGGKRVRARGLLRVYDLFRIGDPELRACASELMAAAGGGAGALDRWQHRWSARMRPRVGPEERWEANALLDRVDQHVRALHEDRRAHRRGWHERVHGATVARTQRPPGEGPAAGPCFRKGSDELGWLYGYVVEPGTPGLNCTAYVCTPDAQPDDRGLVRNDELVPVTAREFAENLLKYRPRLPFWPRYVQW